jgi:hypothetical protein
VLSRQPRRSTGARWALPPCLGQLVAALALQQPPPSVAPIPRRGLPSPRRRASTSRAMTWSITSCSSSPLPWGPWPMLAVRSIARLLISSIAVWTALGLTRDGTDFTDRAASAAIVRITGGPLPLLASPLCPDRAAPDSQWAAHRDARSGGSGPRVPQYRYGLIQRDPFERYLYAPYVMLRQANVAGRAPEYRREKEHKASGVFLHGSLRQCNDPRCGLYG